MKNLLVNLPEDVFINNILLSKVLPIKSLLNLRCVCKYLRKLITSPAFIKMQLSTQLNNNNNNINPLVLIRASYTPVLFSLKFNGADPCHPEKVEFVSPIEHPFIWGSCNGLLCLANGKENSLCLWNPTTKEYKVIPPPLPLTEISISMKVEIGSITYGFGYDHLIDDYKIIRCIEHHVIRFDDYITEFDDYMTKFQVYTLGTNSWRKINNNPYKSYFVLWDRMTSKSTVFVNGALHWIMSTSDSGRLHIQKMMSKVKIVSFNIEKEEFREIYLPSFAEFKLVFYLWSFSIQVLRGCLCVFEHDSSNGSSCNVWMMMDYGVEGSWTKLFTIVSKYQIGLSSYTLLSFWENDTEILMGSDNVLLVYNLIDNKFRPVEFGEKYGKYKCEIYIQSLVSVNSGVYKGRKRNRLKKTKKVERRI